MTRLITDEDELRRILDINFTPAQMDAITAGLDRPTAVIAGAGSGKTAVMAARVVWLVGHVGIAPERILGLTFTNKAAAELGQRIRASLDRLGHDFEGEPTSSTYHAFAGSLISEHGLRIGIEPDRRIVTDASRFQRLARAIESYPSVLQHVSTHVPTIVGQVATLDAQLAEHLVDTGTLRDFDRGVISRHDPKARVVAVVRDAADAAQARTELSRLVDAYRALKDDDGVLDFSDQMAAGALLAREPAVRAAMRERFDVVLLDEYQDTSVAQRDLLKDLFDGLPVTAVGDPAQGIYGWRGAAAGNLREFLDDFRAADGSSGRRLPLSQTRRCAPAIIEAANMIAADFYASDDSATPLDSAKPSGGRVDVGLYATIDEEIDHVVAGIVAAHDDGVPLRKIAILVRIARENGAIVAALREAGIPFEIVGLNGLLDLPEVVDVVSLLEVVDDATANPAVLRLLTGPRWNVGARDLALLGRRAGQLTRSSRRLDGAETFEEVLASAVAGTDPTEVVSLADALGDLGSELGYSAEARARFAELASIIDGLRRHAGDPLTDLARRAVRAIDLDVELEASHVTGGSDNLALFLDAIAAFAESDRYASLAGLIAYLRAENAYNEGMEVATPSAAESVKLLTIHRAKGLEWDTVFVPFVSEGVFPGRGRSRWVGNGSILPSPLRGDRGSVAQIEDWTPAGKRAYDAEVKAESDMEERRLAYVAYTRAEERLVITGHWWGRTQKNPRGPSEYLVATRDWLAARGVQALAWAAAPADDATNPHLDAADGIPWPAGPVVLQPRIELAGAVRRMLDGGADESGEIADRAVADRLDELADDIDKLLAEEEARSAAQRAIDLPPTLSATSLLSLAKDTPEFARSLARPMPRQPSAAARFGTRFHAWVESHFGHQGVLLDPEDLPGRGDTDIGSDAELDEVIERFKASPYADRTPVAIESPFSIVLAGQQVIGQIDAVFETPRGFEVVDWKTNRQMSADPLQLAIYRLAWAELRGIDPAQVTAAFYYVRLGEVQTFDDLPERGQLEELLSENGTVLR